MAGRRRAAAGPAGPGSNTDRRRSANLARWAFVADPAISGALYAFAPGLVTTSNLNLVRETVGLRPLGVLWLLVAVGLFTRVRHVAYAAYALSMLALACAVAATAFTGDLESPTAPVRFLVLGTFAWWLRARSVARMAGTLYGDDLTLR